MPKLLGEYWWPDTDVAAGPVLLKEVERIELWLEHVRGRHVAVQAGGCVGLYPNALAAHFEQVYTVEPEAENWECFLRNVRAHNVIARRAAFGDRAGSVYMQLTPGNCGAHYVRHGGEIPMVTIDELHVDACDLIALDVEGAELLALQGAESTVTEFRPVIIAEEKGHLARFDQTERQLHHWMAARDYQAAGFIGRDRVWRP